uniref:Uncharacterized protein n=1 Tax=Caudovirales sp. ctaix4 TaxID=2827635 RepID=A0A8S5S666_9CAUD|nr:MAG TPA: hypothetical protein [Caudovirales sp. ctaix4]
MADLKRSHCRQLAIRQPKEYSGGMKQGTGSSHYGEPVPDYRTEEA